MAHASNLIEDDILAYLKQHEEKDILRFLTCGNVDDGKSTLIGRLLHDSKLIFEDQLASIKKDSQKFNTTNQEFDLALLVDGLQSEREQGITIDVAYRYFSTDKRKFIIADCPGHEQYTRNMATGASTCDLAIILIDARKGIQTQTRRHSYIISLLGIKNVVVAVNKMDLMNFEESVFENIKADYSKLAQQLGIEDVHYVPLSALMGDNVVDRSQHTPWYAGETFIEKLETIKINDRARVDGFRMPVQYVNRPNLDFRGFCGTVAAGDIMVGDAITALPSGKTSTVKSIITPEGDAEFAVEGEAITLTLQDEIDISRGDTIINGESAKVSNTFTAQLVWMADDPLQVNKEYLFKVGTKLIPGRVTSIVHQVDVNTMQSKDSDALDLNEVGLVAIKLNSPVVFDEYKKSKGTGGFIIVDRMTNITISAGMIEQAIAVESNIIDMPYEDRLAKFNAEVLELAKKYFPT